MTSFQVGEKIQRNGFFGDEYVEFVVLEKINDKLYKLQAISEKFLDREVAGSLMGDDNVLRWDGKGWVEQAIPTGIRYSWIRGEVLHIANLGDQSNNWQVVALDENGQHDGRPCPWRPWDIFGAATAEKPANVVHYR